MFFYLARVFILLCFCSYASAASSATWSAPNPPITQNISGPLAVAITPDGKTALVAGSGVSVLVNNNGVWSAPNPPITQNIGPLPSGIAITPDGKTALVANFGSEPASISVLVNNEGVWSAPNLPITLNIGPAPLDVAITPDGTMALITSGYIGGAYGRITVLYNVEEGVWVAPRAPIELTNGVAATGIAITPDGTTALVTFNDSENVGVLINNGGVWSELNIRPIFVDLHPEYIATTPDGTAALVTNHQATSVSVLTNKGGSWSTEDLSITKNVGALPIGVAITPDGTEALVVGNQWPTSAASSVTVLVNNEGVWSAPNPPITQNIGDGASKVAITPDGTMALVVCEAANGVSVLVKQGAAIPK